MKVTPLSIVDIEKKGQGPIYVINNTGNADNTESGILFIAIPRLSGNGSPISLRIPRTWLPIDITKQIAFSQLVPTHEFRVAINNKWIIPVSNEYANYLLSKEGAREEQERLDEEDRRAAYAGPSRIVSGSDSEVVDVNNSKKDQNMFIENGNGYTPQFISKVNRWVAMEDIAVMNEIRGSGKFTRKQLKYIVDHLKSHPKTKELLNRVLSKKKL